VNRLVHLRDVGDHFGRRWLLGVLGGSRAPVRRRLDHHHAAAFGARQNLANRRLFAPQPRFASQMIEKSSIGSAGDDQESK
jgi:hypothetical protein